VRGSLSSNSWCNRGANGVDLLELVDVMDLDIPTFVIFLSRTLQNQAHPEGCTSERRTTQPTDS
jgi:hypothetical protein